MQPIDESTAWNQQPRAVPRFPEPSGMPGNCQSQAQSALRLPRNRDAFFEGECDRFPLHRERN
jgi:hypothetical protein